MSRFTECPFCGEQHKIQMRTEYSSDESDTKRKYIECSVCGARTRGKWFSGRNDCPVFYEEVREQWNRRLEKQKDVG